jgi:broad-specificity NMP kinase
MVQADKPERFSYDQKKINENLEADIPPTVIPKRRL